MTKPHAPTSRVFATATGWDIAEEMNVESCLRAHVFLYFPSQIASFHQTSFYSCRLFRAYTIHCPNHSPICFLMSSERFDKFVSYIPYAVAFLLVTLYFIFVLPHIQDYVIALSGYVTAAQKAAHEQEFPHGCSPLTRYNRPVFEIYGLY